MKLTISRAAALAAFVSCLPAQGDRLYTISAIDDQLRVYDIQSQATINSVTITVGGAAIGLCNGMARDPVTGVTYVIVDWPGSNPRDLCTIDLTTGVATVVGSLGDYYSGFAFRSDGTLFGITGDGGNTPETLYTIDTATAQPTFAVTLGAGSDGEAIAFAGPDSSYPFDLFHASGFGVQNADEILERIDSLNGFPATNVPLTGHDFDELMSLTPYTGDVLLGCDFNADLVAITTSGHVDLLGQMDHSFVRGMAYEVSPSTQAYLRKYGRGCLANTGSIPILIGSGNPTAGHTCAVNLHLAPPNSFGLVAFGTGNNSIPVPSPTCEAQINPVLVSSGFVTSTTGNASFPVTLPLGFPPIDLFAQFGILDGSNFVVSNPLQIHTQ